MIVSELIKQLQQCDPNTLVVQSEYTESNNALPLDKITKGKFVFDGAWSGYFQNDLEADNDPIGLPGCATPAICLWPIN